MQHEKQKDRDNELLMAHKVETQWGCEVAQSNTGACFDWTITRGGELVCFAEFRRRDTLFGQHPTVFIAEHKFLAMLEMGRLQCVPALFIVQHNEGPLVYAVLAANQDWFVSFLTLKQVRDAADIDRKVVNIPTSAFKRIQSKKT
jgi:hypothetical protein